MVVVSVIGIAAVQVEEQLLFRSGKIRGCRTEKIGIGQAKAVAGKDIVGDIIDPAIYRYAVDQLLRHRLIDRDESQTVAFRVRRGRQQRQQQRGAENNRYFTAHMTAPLFTRSVPAAESAAAPGIYFNEYNTVFPEHQACRLASLRAFCDFLKKLKSFAIIFSEVVIYSVLNI